MAAVFDLDTSNVVEYLVVTHIDVVAHADINSRVLDAREDVVLDQAVLAKLGEDPIYTRVDHPVIAD